VTFSFDLAVMGSGLANHSGTVSVASEVPPDATPGSHTVTAAAGAVCTVDGFGGVVAWNIADETENWFRQLPGGNAHYGATVVNNLVYVQDSGGTFALHAADGTVIWHYQTDGYALTPVYDGGNLYVATYNQTSHRFAEIAITASTPTLLWSTAINAGPDQPPVVGDGRVYQISGGQDLRAFSVAQGSVVWADLAAVNSRVGPAVANGVLYVASTGLNNTVLALDDSTGGQLSAVDIGGCGASSQAVIANGTVYWGICEDGIATLTS
jgi:outer membrane protein assembly factor BamB